jgi:hypothetical protein
VRKLRTTNVIERCFVEGAVVHLVVCFGVDRIIYSIFPRFNLEWKPAPSTYLHKLLDDTLSMALATRIRIIDRLAGARW